VRQGRRRRQATPQRAAAFLGVTGLPTARPGPGPGEQRLIVYQAPPGSRDHDALALLTMIAADDAPTRMAT